MKNDMSKIHNYRYHKEKEAATIWTYLQNER